MQVYQYRSVRKSVVAAQSAQMLWRVLDVGTLAMLSDMRRQHDSPRPICPFVIGPVRIPGISKLQIRIRNCF